MSLNDLFREVKEVQEVCRKNTNVLLAVSGGIDSVVLLDLFLQVPLTIRPRIGVVHFNHQLREESENEEQYLREICKKENISFYTEKWAEGKTVKSNVEKLAREARYDFFKKVYQENRYDVLMTAHHGDDLAETIIMKITSGTKLQNLVGIRAKTQLKGMEISRPLLAFSKEDILKYGESRNLTFFEDESNQSAKYFRNRIRHSVVPLLKKENENFLKHVHSLVKQIDYANDIIEEKVEEVASKIISRETENLWRLNVKAYQEERESVQYMLVIDLLQEALIKKHITVNEAQVKQIISMLNSDKPQQEVHLNGNWIFKKTYNTASLMKKDSFPPTSRDFKTEIIVGKGQYLSEKEWIGIVPLGKEKSVIPPEALKWTEYTLLLKENTKYPLILRRRQEGDRIQLNEEGHSKKVRRIFIDNKVAKEIREKTWIVTDFQNEILWIIPFRKSYLSIARETDKIQYRLIYLKDEQDLEGEPYVRKGH